MGQSGKQQSLESDRSDFEPLLVLYHVSIGYVIGSLLLEFSALSFEDHRMRDAEHGPVPGCLGLILILPPSSPRTLSKSLLLSVLQVPDIWNGANLTLYLEEYHSC